MTWYIQPIYGEGEGCPEERGPAVIIEADSEADARAAWWERGRGRDLSCLDGLQCRPVGEVSRWRVEKAERLP